MTARENKKKIVLGTFLVLTLTLGVIPAAFAQEGDKSSILAEGSNPGQRIYNKRCSGCHGMDGKGDGPAAERFFPHPRDFTRGLYKFRTTPKDTVPTDDNLFRTISKGLPGTGMPAWENTLSEQDIRAVIGYIKTFSPEFSKQTPQPITIGPKVASSKESIEKGKELFHGKATCFMCHGPAGRGDGPLAPSLKDVWNNPVRPRNLTKGWFFRWGHNPEEIYTRIDTGISGTPMPSFDETLSNEERWDVVNYVYSLSPAKRQERKDVILAKRVNGPLPDDPNDPKWNALPSYKFPLLGQVIRDPRLFFPSIEEVDVKAMHNSKEIALLLIWDDTTQSKADPSKGVLDDGIGVQFPAVVQSDRKPYFLRGNEKDPVYLWVWTADGKVEEMKASGLGTDAPLSADAQSVKGTVAFKEGEYRLLLKRPLASSGKEPLPFELQKFIPISFSAWDGSRGEGGTKFSLSAWYYLFLEAPSNENVYLYPTILAVVVIGLEIWMVRKGKSYKGNGTGPK
jgi:DMSO reductase family type II enzyme heme b subunit